MKSSVKSLLSAALFGAVALVGQAQPAFKILVVDVSKLYEGHWQTQEQNAKLEKENQEAGAQLQQLNAEGTALVDQYKDLVEQTKSPTLTTEARAKVQADADKKRAEIDAKQNDVNAFQQNTQRALQQRIKTFRDLMLEQITTAATKIAKDKGATILLDKYGPTVVGISNILYSDPAYDITDEVMKELNKDRPATPATPMAAPTAAPAPAASAPGAAPAAGGGAPMITIPGAKK